MHGEFWAIGSIRTMIRMGQRGRRDSGSWMMAWSDLEGERREREAGMTRRTAIEGWN